MLILKKINFFIKNFILLNLNLLVILFYKIIKIDEKKIVYIPVQFKCAGNAYCLMLEWAEIYKDYKHIFLCDQNYYLGNNIYLTKFNLKFLYHFASAKFIIRESEYNSIGLIPNKSSLVIQLWHAAGAFKKFGLDIPNRSKILRFFRKIDINRWNILFCSSSSLINIYSKAFNNFNKENIFVSGLSRNDLLYKIFLKKDKIRESFNILKDKLLILYAPTFRESKIKSDYSFILNLVYHLTKKFPSNYILGIRLHPNIPQVIMDKIEWGPKIINLNDISTEEVLVISDFLVTDYSSIIFDFALLERPMFFYVPDFKEYFDKRGFYYDYNKFVPGPISYSVEELYKHIIDYDFEKWKDKIRNFKNKFNPYFDGKNSYRIIRKILEINNNY